MLNGTLRAIALEVAVKSGPATLVSCFALWIFSGVVTRDRDELAGAIRENTATFSRAFEKQAALQVDVIRELERMRSALERSPSGR